MGRFRRVTSSGAGKLPQARTNDSAILDILICASI